MRHIDLLRTLALSSALILVLGGNGYAGNEDTADTGELPSAEASPPAEAPEEVAVETSPPAEEADTEASDAKESPSVEAAPPAEPAESADPTSSSAVGPDTEDSEATEE
jgi:hypothetical protein